MNGALSYLRRNWGAPFVIAFVLLLIVAALELGFTSTGQVNDIAAYAFYSLVLGIALQIVCYAKYGEGNEGTREVAKAPPRPPMFAPRTRKLLAVLTIAIIAIAIGTTAYVYTSSHGFNSLTITLNYVNSLREPGSVVVVAFAVSATGGTPPYNFSASWPDGAYQFSTTGAFSRDFVNQTLPTSVSVAVSSSDGQRATKSVAIPTPSSSSTSSASSTGSSNSISSSETNPTTISSTESSKYPQLVVSVSFAKEFVEPGGNTTLFLGVSAIGGESPYNFVVVWSDGAVQSNTAGTFSRTFTSGETIPTSARVTVISGDDQSGIVTANFTSSGS